LHKITISNIWEADNDQPQEHWTAQFTQSPWYSWNIAKSAVKHNKSIKSTQFTEYTIPTIAWYFPYQPVYHQDQDPDTS
jgi:hypothetical protein